jgi:hypothetical protein
VAPRPSKTAIEILVLDSLNNSANFVSRALSRSLTVTAPS